MTATLFPCPSCGATDAWKADYYEAVWQTCTVEADENGRPVVTDYTGVTGSYDDGSTENDALRCRECGYEVTLGTFKLELVGETSADVQFLLDGLEVGSVSELKTLVDAARRHDEFERQARAAMDQAIERLGLS